MFVRQHKTLPADPAYPANLEELGFTVNQRGEFISTSAEHNTQVYFNFFHTDNERVNEVRKEAMHTAARKAVKDELARLGVKEVFLTGDDGDLIEEEKPEGPHVTVYATDLDVLKEKMHVVVVIGEHNSDAGILAYRSLMREGGIDKGEFNDHVHEEKQTNCHMLLGSIVGMVKQLNTMGFGALNTRARASSESSSISTASTLITGGDAPGVLILNPGQLLYSHLHGKNMGYKTWSARTRSTAISPGFKIHKDFNHIKGHIDADEHINTVFDKVLPQIINRAARLHVVGITDGAERFVNWFARSIDEDETSAHQIHAMAFTEPTHDPRLLPKNSAVHEQLKRNARSWIRSPKPLGTFINAPGATEDFRTEEEKEEHRILDEQKAAQAKANEDARLLAQEEPHAGAQPVVVARSGNVTENAENVSIVGDDPVEVSYAGLPRDLSNFSMTSSITSSDAGAYEALDAAARDFALNQSTTTSDLIANPEDNIITNESDCGSINGSSVAGDNEVSDFTKFEDDDYDYANNRVSCPTYSGGVADMDELILPTAMGKVLEWFSHRATQV
jgi:hypothetical protein